MPVDVEKELPCPQELHYRRGFHQGVASALNALLSGATEQELRNWERQVRTWRSSQKPGAAHSQEPPPAHPRAPVHSQH